MEYRGRLLAHTLAHQSLKMALQQWVRRLNFINIDLDSRASALAAHVGKNTLRRTLIHWRTRSAARIADAQTANVVRDRLRLSRTFSTWKALVEEQTADESKADVARSFFLQRGAWSAWRTAVAERKQERWFAAKETERLRAVFTTWYSLTKVALENRALVQQLRDKVDRVSCISLLYPSSQSAG